MEKTKPAIGAMLESKRNEHKDYWIVIGYDGDKMEIKLLGDTFKTMFPLQGFLNAENWNTV